MTQIRNSQLVSNLQPDFIGRNEPSGYLGRVISMYQALPGLRGFWPMSSVDEAGNVYDLSGQVRTLTNNNSATFGVTDFLPYSQFDGTNQDLSRADEAGLDITDGLTIGLWVYPISTPGTREVIGKRGAAGQRSYWIRYNNSNQMVFLVSVDGTAQTIVTSSALTNGNWYFVVGRYTVSTELKLWVNGTTVTNTTSIPASIFNSTSQFNIASGNGAAYSNIRASMGFLCNSVLSDSLINILYNQTRLLFDNQ